jgi:hypothetical protein
VVSLALQGQLWPHADLNIRQRGMRTTLITQSPVEFNTGPYLRQVVITSMHTVQAAAELMAEKVRESLIHLI